MGVFDSVTFKWEGVDYTVPSDKVMPLIAVVEDIATLEDLVSPKPKRVQLARAFSAALQYAGAKVSAEQVYEKLYSVGEAQQITQFLVDSLLSLMIPPEHLQSAKSKGAKATPKKARKATAKPTS